MSICVCSLVVGTLRHVYAPVHTDSYRTAASFAGLELQSQVQSQTRGLKVTLNLLTKPRQGICVVSNTSKQAFECVQCFGSAIPLLQAHFCHLRALLTKWHIRMRQDLLGLV